ncbi:carbon-nitrogen hydrolase family protein [Roseivirga pacifica]|uniref:carbon-nitrogen hydrolase family protein n=1 Tax=Roseivirga pacifica TaxID=1267423 RepID=UPI002094D8C2|nr:carbon-nitrogen hydrolase family protein [Roseivirga pacifica]MCO6360863.1 nitrilase [Roseivirga pacifica]MCO6368752.1 nitrilase [Roseivirga pacifica]MCO6372895.1 nitrilase [Roseivirga pacifica]MCO6376954.1 nitrilase [Roseivirga pacifica]MCO6377768.1 nitrilase [Roseivirga pacifica]
MAIFTAAVVQAAPVLFDLESTLEKTSDLIDQANGAELILFPEAFVSVYPRGLSFGTVVGSRSPEGRELWQRYWDSSIAEGDAAYNRLGAMAKAAKAFLAIGVNEKDLVSGTMYCSIFYFGPNGDFLGKHRKIKPTAQERIIWGEDDGSTLSTFDTSLGRIGGLICWENYMPAARMSMYQKGVQLYLAPTADARENWQHSMKHIALEGRCFVFGCNQFVTKDMYPNDLPSIADLQNQPDVMSNGGSVIIDPLGNVLAGPLWGTEGILTAEINLDLITQSKLDFDPIGHYARPDIFELNVKNQPATQKV